MLNLLLVVTKVLFQVNYYEGDIILAMIVCATLLSYFLSYLL